MRRRRRDTRLFLDWAVAESFGGGEVDDEDQNLEIITCRVVPTSSHRKRIEQSRGPRNLHLRWGRVGWTINQDIEPYVVVINDVEVEAGVIVKDDTKVPC